MIISSKQFDKIKEVQVWFFQFLCRNFIGKGPALNIRVLLNLNLNLLREKKRNTGRYTNTSKTVTPSSFYQDSIFSFKQYVYLHRGRKTCSRQANNERAQFSVHSKGSNVGCMHKSNEVYVPQIFCRSAVMQKLNPDPSKKII